MFCKYLDLFYMCVYMCICVCLDGATFLWKLFFNGAPKNSVTRFNEKYASLNNVYNSTIQKCDEYRI